MEADGARIYIIDETAADDSRTERLIRLARLYAAEEAMPLPQTLCIAKGEYGKPYFENAPWLRFSVSHSGGLWVCALCRCDVGIDIEQHAARDHAALARRFFHPQEIEYTHRGGTGAFYSVWTAKESYVKLLSTGIGCSFSHFSVVERGTISGDRLFARFTSIPVRDGYSLTLCRWYDE